MSQAVAAGSRPSARAKARRPHLVPREAPAIADDPDVIAVAHRTSDAAPADPSLDDQGTATRQAYDILRDTPPMTIVPPAPAAAVSPLSLAIVTYADVDRLWDWARQDQAGAAKFLGVTPPHSQALYAFVGQLLDQEKQGTALLRAIYASTDTGPVHLGFISLLPITRTSRPAAGVVHCYLCPEAHGTLPQMLPLLLDIAAEQEPDLTLIVATTDYAFAKLLQPHGFQLSIALTRPPAHARK